MKKNVRKPMDQNMRATAQAPTAGSTSPLPEESPLVQDLRLRLKDVQRAYQEQLQISAKHKHRLRKLQGEKEALKKNFEELQKQLTEAREDKETLMEFGKNLLKQKDKEREQMIEQGRQVVNKYVHCLYEENNNLKRFSQEQQTLALRNQEKVEQLEEQIKLQKANSHDYSSDLTIEKLEVANIELTQKLEQYEKEKRALKSTLQQAIEEGETKEMLLVSTQQELQKEQAEKQALQRKITALESALVEQTRAADEALNAQVFSHESILEAERHTAKEALNKQLLALESTFAAEMRAAEDTWNKQVLSLESAVTEQRQTAAEALNKAQEREESLNTELNKVQTLQNDLDSQKISFTAVIEKCQATHKVMVEENTLHQKTIKELSTALNHSEEERTSALLRCEELQMSLKDSGDQLQQIKVIAEELQAEVDKKKKKKRRWWKCWQ